MNASSNIIEIVNRGCKEGNHLDLTTPRLTPNEALSLCTFTTAVHNDQSPCKGQDLIVKKLGHHHIELIDSHGGTIHLMRLRYEQ